MKNFVACILFAGLALSSVACVGAPPDPEDENVGTEQAPLPKQFNLTGSQCTVVQCNGLANPFGTCQDASCSLCDAGGHESPGDWQQEFACLKPFPKSKTK